MRLTNQEWLNNAKTQALLASFGEVPLRFVGGCVRDTIMGRAVGDIDCATTALPKQVIALIEQAGHKAVPTGLKHGTITAVIDGKPFEITTLRKDVACDGRHAEVEYTDDWQLDAMRRDFTLNALYCDAEGHIYDYTNGEADARAGHIRFIGDASARIAEDALRILRFFRFSATHGNGTFDSDGLKACAQAAHHVKALSGERIQREMFRLLQAPNPRPALEAMQQSGLLAMLELETREALVVAAHPHPILRLALLLPANDTTAAKRLTERWRLSNQDRDMLLMLTEHPVTQWPDSDDDIIRTARHLKPDAYRLLLWRNAALLNQSSEETTQMIARFDALEMPVFPVSGQALLNAGIPAGAQVGETLRALEQRWEDSGYQLSKKELLEML